MSRANPWQSYRQVATQTASAGQLVLMLYDGAIQFLERALLGFKADDPLEFNQTINNNVLRAQDIVRELSASLDMQRGGELSGALRRLYDYMDHRLHEANRFKTEEGITDVLRRLTVLRDSWSEMLRKTDVQSPGPEDARLSATG
jgi:flagellar protein FliS